MYLIKIQNKKMDKGNTHKSPNKNETNSNSPNKIQTHTIYLFIIVYFTHILAPNTHQNLIKTKNKTKQNKTESLRNNVKHSM